MGEETRICPYCDNAVDTSVDPDDAEEWAYCPFCCLDLYWEETLPDREDDYGA